ncbi:sulfite exporter TauE/SafE family protein [Flavobacterium sp. NRK F10]|uniref:sulfite exporter TauE/SafE family protein n=1 Tax=Flavobacterium sp. NRK F10 TaxID=2954931 RepID=UPI0020913638|nr:sulfite exporter TauE/SafE family protein [Flavobacterium sp. NRK F10]MCO6173668.1 sulfite exporter TauE/SafE family protein [Flavobacterium sp. NRK F10]
MELLGYLGALLIGLVLGLTGGGGSMLTVPVLTYLLHINPVTATAYSLFIVGTTSVVGAIHNYQKKLVDVKNGIIFAIPSFIGVYLTRKFLVPLLPDVIFQNEWMTLSKGSFLMLLFAVIMLFASYSMLKAKETSEQPKEVSLFTLLIQTFFIGVLIGFVGAGGGFLIIPTLVLFAHLSMKKAIGTSLFVISMNSLIGFLGDVQNLEINWKFLLSFTLVSIAGIFIGTYLNKFINEKQLKKGFAYFVLAMAVFILFKEML